MKQVLFLQNEMDSSCCSNTCHTWGVHKNKHTIGPRVPRLNRLCMTWSHCGRFFLFIQWSVFCTFLLRTRSWTEGTFPRHQRVSMDMGKKQQQLEGRYCAYCLSGNNRKVTYRRGLSDGHFWHWGGEINIKSWALCEGGAKLLTMSRSVRKDKVGGIQWVC